MIRLKAKIALVILFVFGCGIGCAVAQYYDFSAVCPTGQTLYYYITDATNHYVTIVAPGGVTSSGWNNYTKPTGNITLSSSVTYNGHTYTVKSISDYAFWGCRDLTGSLTIPSSVTKIGSHAFDRCSGFTGSLTIPSSVTKIGSYAFFNCSGFTGSLTIPSSVTSIERYAFYGCSGFTGNLTIPSFHTSIENSVFFGCSGFNSLTIPSSVTSIGASAFYGCSGLTGNLIIPSSVTSIREKAFRGCSGFTGNLTIPNSVTSIGAEAFRGCSGFTGNLTLPSSITSIGVEAFYICSGFTGNLTIPSSVTSISEKAFSGCGFTGNLTIPSSVTSIGVDAFMGCNKFATIVVNSSNTHYDSRENCKALINTSTNELMLGCKYTTIPNSVTSIGDYAFYNCSGFTGSLTIPSSVTSIGSYAFFNCSGLTGNLIIPSSVTSIKENAFRGCSGFTGNLTIPSSVTSIGSSAFYGCSAFTGNLTLPSSITSISENAFRGCSGFTGSLIIPNSITTIGNDAFSGCSGFTGSLTIPSSVTSIGSYAFYNCSGFTGSLTIPSSVTSIGSYAFYNCSGFLSVFSYATMPPTLSSYSFTNVPKSITVFVPCGTAETYAGWGGFSNFIEMCPREITAFANPAEGGTVTGGGTIEGGQTCTLTATANQGYVFSNWIENGNVISTDSTYSFIAISDRTLVANFLQDGNITFTDDNAKTLCVANWDTNGDGELSYAEAAAVTSLGDVFKENTTIQSFTELEHFISLSTIGEQAFFGCTALTQVTIPTGVVSIENKAFWNCPALQTVNFNAVNCNSMQTTYNSNTYSVFSNNTSGGTPAITKVVFGNGVTKIPDYAFKGAQNINSRLIIRSSVTEIGRYAFYGCNSITQMLIQGNGLQSIGNYAFYNCSALTTALNLPNSVTSIGSYAFGGCSALSTALNIPNSVTSIGSYAFCDCSQLPSLTIGENVATIGDYAFSGCSALNTALNIPNSVTSIGSYAFYGCSQLPSLTIGENVATIGDYAFRGCSALNTALNIPNSVTSIGNYAFYGCSQLPSLTIGENVATVGNYAFWNCPNLTAVSFNATNCTQMHTRIGTSLSDYQYYSVFNSGTSYGGATPIVTLTLGENVTRIPNYAFKNSTNLTSTLTIPNATIVIGQYAFYGAQSTELTIGEGVETIGGWVFWNCPNLATVHFNAINCTSISSMFGPSDDASPIVTLTIGENVTRIPAFAFRNSSNAVGSLIIPNSVTSIGDYAFQNCSGFTGDLVIPNTVTSIGDYAFQNCSGFTGDLVIPNTVTAINKYAFNGCSGFNGNLVISNSVTSIGQYAFYNCSGFTGDLVIPNTVTAINQYAFNGCSGFNGILVIPNSVSSISNYAFQNCSGITALIAESINPPTAQSNSFQGMNYSIPFHIPYGKISSYQSATGWSNFTNRKEQYQFELLDDDLWSDDINWYQGELPTANDVVCLISDCHLDVDANILHLYVQNANDVLTINSGKTLTGGINTRLASQLIIAEGGQLVNNYGNARGTVQRNVSGYGTGDGGWYTIAAPIYSGMSVDGITTGTYDLYYYDEPTHYWMNVKQTDNNFTTLNPAQGYLYANQSPTTVSLAGQLNASNAEISIPVTYTAGELAGFNLVGNPYTNNINITDVKINGTAQTAFYRAEGGSNFVAYVAEDNEPIKVGQGFFVKATEEGTLTFGSTPTRGSNTQENSYLRLVLNKDDQVADRAYLRMNEGERLEKMSTSGAHSQLYFKNSGERYAVADNEAENGSMPLYLEKVNGTYTIEAALLNAECDYLHLIDNLTGADIDLLETPNYTFDAKTTDYASRFKLVFNPESNNIDGNNEDFAFISDGQLVVTGKGTLQVFDALGRVIVSRRDGVHTVFTNGLTPGVYVLRLTDENNVRTQKIVIK